jgi:hypothetical protein
MKWVVLAGVVVVSSVLATSATAHHSFAATYFEKESVTIEGQLVQLQFRNPHSFAQMIVRDSAGHDVRYAVEWRGAGELGAQGVTQRTLQVGDFLVITGNPSRQAADHRVRVTRQLRPRDGFNWVWRQGN